MKRIISLLLIGMLSFSTTVSVVSCDRTETSVTPVIKEEPAQTNYEVTLAEMQKFNDEFFAIVDRVEPYITTNKDQTYTVDWEGFEAANPNLNTDQVKLVGNLKLGIPIANAAIFAAAKAPAEEQARWTKYYWWGKRECYTGYDAIVMASMMQSGAAISSFYWIASAIFQAYAGWAWGLYSGCGGFCFNASWVGGVWLTCP